MILLIRRKSKPNLPGRRQFSVRNFVRFAHAEKGWCPHAADTSREIALYLWSGKGAYLPLNLASRFSRKADMPSTRSAAWKQVV